ncbi:MAG: AMP-binding protein [Dissulfurispiraceae bacterium]
MLNVKQRSFHDGAVRFRIVSDSFSMEDAEQSIQSRFEKQVVKFSSHIAIKEHGVRVTYDSLNKAANRIARAILAECEGEVGQVALLFEQGRSVIIALIAVLKAGGIFIPLDFSHPSERSLHILEDSQATLIITDNNALIHAKNIAWNRLRILNIDEIAQETAADNLGLPVLANSPAYILYTSGSTGKPKGVLHTHRNLLHFIRNYTNTIGITAADRLSLLPSFTFLASLYDAFGALFNGAGVCLYNVKKKGIAQLAEWLIREKITVYHSVPTLFRHFASSLTHVGAFPNLRVIDLGGEPIHTRDIELFKRHFDQHCVAVINLACTEAGHIAQYFIDRDSELSGITVPVGYATDDVIISIVDDEGRELGTNQVGEILVKSRHLSPGYWRNPELTNAAFRFSGEEAADRQYRTGDIGLIRENGVLQHMGRKDYQVKIRGQRVEIPEIEIALQAISKVRDAVVVAAEDKYDSKRLIAFIVPSEGETLGIHEIRGILKNKLPDYMIPAQFIFLNALPSTTTGKVDRHALLTQKFDRSVLDKDYVGPTNAIENGLSEIWAEVLDVKRIGINDDFFDLGGDSLMVFDIFCWIEQEYGKIIPPSVLYQASTIKKLAAAVENYKEPASVSCLVPALPHSHRPPLFCVPPFAGTALVFKRLLKYLDPEQPVYGIDSSENVLNASLEEAASHYVREILKILPSGPFLLLGFSSGGILAFEIAQQLSGLHLEVPFLGMLDTFFYPLPLKRACTWKTIVTFGFFKNFASWAYYSLPYWLSRRLKELRRPKKKKMRLKREKRRLQVIDWMRNYTPRHYDGRIIFYRAKGQRPFDPTSDSRLPTGICDFIEIIGVSGEHNSILHEPYVREIAKNIDSKLRDITT